MAGDKITLENIRGQIIAANLLVAPEDYYRDLLMLAVDILRYSRAEVSDETQKFIDQLLEEVD